MQFPQLFIMMATIFTATVQAVCSPPVKGECQVPPGQVGVFTCKSRSKIM
ncbi:hypothetical protein PspLS_01652 [Pyricularia sp. CBS 133598]|nr:hypothetical protein PspLS_01652 [Pyricularia sp. CBS 133598]